MTDSAESYRDRGGLPAEEAAGTGEHDMVSDVEADLLRAAVRRMLENAGFVIADMPNDEGGGSTAA